MFASGCGTFMIQMQMTIVHHAVHEPASQERSASCGVDLLEMEKNSCACPRETTRTPIRAITSQDSAAYFRNYHSRVGRAAAVVVVLPANHFDVLNCPQIQPAALSHLAGAGRYQCELHFSTPPHGIWIARAALCGSRQKP